MRIKMWHLSKKNEFKKSSMILSQLDSDEVRISFHYCGICGSDLSTYEGRRSSSYPKSLGHEFVALVDKVGNNVTCLRNGDVVVSDLNYRCNQCKQCNRSKSHLCEKGQIGKFTNRGFSTHANINVNYLTKVNSNNLYPQYCFVEPLSCVIHAFNHAKLDDSTNILVIGCGGLGTCMGLLLQDKQLSADIWDINTDRCNNLAKIMNQLKVTEPIKEFYDIVFDLTGSSDGLKVAISSTCRGGKLISMSHLDGYGTSNFLLPMLTRKDIWFIVSYLNGKKENITNAIELIDRVWTDKFDCLFSLNSILKLPSIFDNRRSSFANKEILSLSDWHSRND